MYARTRSHHASQGGSRPTLWGGTGLLARFYQAVAHGKRDDLGAVLHVKLVEDVAEVVLDRIFGDHQPFGELAIAGDALHQQVEHLPLSLGEGIKGFMCGGRRSVERSMPRELDQK